MKKTLSLFVIIALSWVIQAAAEDAKLPAIGINNLCETQFPIEARSDYNHPQYKLAYDRCIGAYNSYLNTLEQAIKDWENASNSGKKEDWDKAEAGFNSVYEIMNINGESLVGWFDRDIMLTNIGKYIKAVKERVVLYIPKVTEPPLMSQSGSNGDISGSGSIKDMGKEAICKKGFMMNKKTRKCRKQLKSKSSSPLK